MSSILKMPKIQSAITPSEAALLAEVCEGKDVLELGSELGFSTIIIGQVCKSLVSVDWHRGYKPGGLHGMGGQWTGPAWLHYVEEHFPGAVGRRITGVFGQFENVLPLLGYQGFDVVFLDGGHEREGLERYLPMIRRLDAFTFITHDWGHALCEEKAVLTEYGWAPDRVVGHMAVGRGL